MLNYKNAARSSKERLDILFDILREVKRPKFSEEEVRVVVDEDSESEEDSLDLPAVE